MFGSHEISKVLLYLLLIGIITMAYLPALKGGFLLDDYPNIINSSAMKIETMDYETMHTLATSGLSSRIGRPISVVSFGLNYYFTGFDPFYFKLVNLIIHVINSILLFIMASVIQKNFFAFTSQEKTEYRYLPLFLALMWGIHPINVSSVAYVVQRMNILAVMFMMVGALFYVLARLKISNRLVGQGVAILAMFACTALGVLSKENAILLPLIIVLIESLLIPQQDSIADNSLTVFVLIPTVLVSIVVILQPEYVTKGYFLREFDAAQRLVLQAEVLTDYLQDLVFPLHNKLTFYKDTYPLPIIAQLSARNIGYMLVIALLTLGSLIAVKKRPIIAFCGLLFFVGHLLESTLIPLEIAFEHRNYLPGIGIILALALFVIWVFEKLRMNWKIGGFLFVGFLLIQTYFQCLNWSNSFLLIEAEAQKSPDSLRANIDLARMYTELYINTKDKQYRDKALRQLGNVLHLNHSSSAAYIYIILLNSIDGTPTKNVIYEGFLRSLAHFPPEQKNPKRVNELITMRFDNGYMLPLEFLEKAVDIMSNNPIPHIDGYHSEILVVKSRYLWVVKNDKEAAIVCAREALKISPNSSTYHENLIRMLVAVNKIEEAQVEYEKYEALFPVKSAGKYDELFQRKP